MFFVTFPMTHQIGYASNRKHKLPSGRTDHAYVDAPEWTNSHNFFEREDVKFEKASTSTINKKKRHRGNVAPNFHPVPVEEELVAL